jgi:CHAT domain-containing protein
MPGKFRLFILLALLTSCMTSSTIATKTIQLGDAANNQNSYEEAIGHYEEYIRLSPQLGLYRNPSMEAAVYRKLAYAYSTQGNYRRSIKYLNDALAIDSTIASNNLEMIEDLRELGVVHAYMNEYKTALRYLTRSLTLSEGMTTSIKDVKRTSVSDTYMSLAQVHLTLGNFRESEAMGNSALQLYSNISGEYEGVIEAELLLGILHREKGNLTESIRLVERSKVRAEKNQLNTTRHNQALGEIYFLKGEPENGVRFKLLAANQAEHSNIKPQIIIAYMRLGDAYQQLGDQVKANDYYQKALSIQATSDTLGARMPSLRLRLGDVQMAYDHYMQSGSTIGGALVCLRLGDLQYQKSNMDSAKAMFQMGKSLFEKSGSIEGINKANIGLSKVHVRNKDYDPAIGLLRQAEETTAQPDLHWQIKYHLGRIHEYQGNIDSAYSYYKSAIRLIDEIRGNLSIEEFKTLFSNSKVEVYDHMISLLLKNKAVDTFAQDAVQEAFGYNEQSRSRAFLDVLGNHKIDAKSSRDSSLLEKEQLLRLKIHQIAKELNESDTYTRSSQELETELFNAQSDYDQLIQQIKLNNDAYASIVSIEPPSLERIQSLLDGETAIVEYWVGEEALIIWVITESEVFNEIVPVTAKDLQREISFCRRSISTQFQEGIDRSKKQLSSFLIHPVGDKVKGYKNLVIIPHNDLHFLPFQALASTADKFLIEDHVISYAPSASVLNYCLNKRNATGDNFLGLALGDMTIGNFPALPGTELELDELTRIFPDMLSKTNEGFSETFLKEQIEDKSYVHIATHGVLNKTQPLYSYLLMSPGENDDGRLTVSEIFALDLQCKLVTLSACETGLGDIGASDELTGLSRAFIYAGSPGVIVSLWKVDDAITAWLMVRFYEYIKGGHNASEALAFAQRDIIQHRIQPLNTSGSRTGEMSQELVSAVGKHTAETLRNPYYWSPFVLIGNGAVK